jgi:glutaredoxin-related protein
MATTSSDRCSFEVVYKKNAEGVEVIDNVVVRTGLSDASVTLTIPQVYNLARLLDIVQAVAERGSADRLPGVQALPRAQAVRSD